ncbi:putative nuclease of the RecB family [Thermoplasmatales archaeon SCGC AB-540-F20]|nr:putative nuclease of the RecB family [Thermoplasmatales archaeon SCGC AB-540-F20]
MNKNQFEKYKKEFIQWYGSYDTHFYVTKAKTFSISSVKDIRKGLKELSDWFIEHKVSTEEEKHFDNFYRGSQTILGKLIHSRLHGFQIWDNKTQLYFTYILEKNNLISAKNRSPEIFKKYRKVFDDIQEGKSYEKLEKEYGKKLLYDIAANARNFKNIFSKLGFAWMEKNTGMFITSTGERLIEEVKEDLVDHRIREIMERQATKWQLSNPAAPLRYNNLRIFPFIFLLELLLKIKDDPFISKLEYSLMVSRAKEMKDLNDIHQRLLEYRALSDDQKKSLKNDVERIKRERRNLFEEIMDSSSKELSFFGSTLSCRYGRKDREPGIFVIDKNQARSTIKEIKDKKITFVSYERKDDWFNYFGEWEDIPTQQQAVDYLLSTGKKDEVKRIVELEEYEPFIEQARESIQEYHIEDFYHKNLELIERGLSLFVDKYEKTGRQYPTEVGRIDLLCVTPDGQYVVIEFKKGKSSDKIIGQVFRYMGWVLVNLSKDKTVRGIIVARDFDHKLKYAIKGIQYTEEINLLKVIKHQFDVEEVSIDSI